MKHLSSLTTFFITFLFVVYLGVFAGLRINNVIANKKVIITDTAPLASSAVLSVAEDAPVPSPSANKIAQVPQTQTKSTTGTKISPTAAPVKSAATPTSAGGQTASPAAPAAPAQEASTPPPAAAAPPPAADTSTPPPAPTQQPTQEPTQEPAPPAPDPRCIVTISGGQYDVTVYRNAHSGGNVFQCGSDMTAVFLSQHPANYLQKMAQYKI